MEKIMGVEPNDEEHQQILLGIEVLYQIFGGKERLIDHVAKNHGVIEHPVPEIQQLVKRLGFDKPYPSGYSSDYD